MLGRQLTYLYSPRLFSSPRAGKSFTGAFLWEGHAHSCATYITPTEPGHRRGRVGSGLRGFHSPSSGSGEERPIKRYDSGLLCVFFFLQAAPSSSFGVVASCCFLQLLEGRSYRSLHSVYHVCNTRLNPFLYILYFISTERRSVTPTSNKWSIHSSLNFR